MNILIFTRYYLPGFNAGGPIVSLSNFVHLLHKSYEFMIVTGNKDLGAREAYKGVTTRGWIQHKSVKVFYSIAGISRIVDYVKIFRQKKPKYIYLNSLFDLEFTFLPFILAILFSPNSKIVLAPRGELSSAALALKNRRKYVHIVILKWVGMLRNVTFHGTSVAEVERIKMHFSVLPVVFMENMSASPPVVTDIKKYAGNLRMVTVGRVSPIKNIDFLLDVLLQLGRKELDDVHVNLDLFGFLEDKEYWRLCRKKIHKLPNWIQVNYKGSIEQQSVSKKISEYHLFVMPTKGENFGHSIAESLAAGTPVLISDRTPWGGVDRGGAGSVVSLDQLDSFIKNIEHYLFMSGDKYTVVRNRVGSYYSFYSSEVSHRVTKQASKIFH